MPKKFAKNHDDGVVLLFVADVAHGVDVFADKHGRIDDGFEANWTVQKRLDTCKPVGQNHSATITG